MKRIPYRFLNPLVDIYLKDPKNHFRPFTLYVDSGASITTLTADDAVVLGLELAKGTELDLRGISGSIKAYVHKIPVKFLDEEFDARIAFSESNETPRLLGRLDIFSRFKICLDDYESTVSFTPKK